MTNKDLSTLVTELVECEHTLATAPKEITLPHTPSHFNSFEEMKAFVVYTNNLVDINNRVRRAKRKLEGERLELRKLIYNMLPMWDVKVKVGEYWVWKASRDGVHLERIADETQ